MTGAQVFNFESVALSPAMFDPISGVGPLTFASPNGSQTFLVGPTFDPVYNYGTGKVLVATRNTNPIVFTITSPTALSAFGIDFGFPTDLSTPTIPFTFALNNGFSQTVTVAGSGPAGGSKTFNFFGVVSPTAFTTATITVQSGAIGQATFDNVTIVATPEPGTVGLVAIGASLALVTARRRRRNA